MNKRTKGAILASAVGALFIAGAAFAQDSAPSGGAQAQAASVKCVGANACKGQNDCKGAKNAC